MLLHKTSLQFLALNLVHDATPSKIKWKNKKGNGHKCTELQCWTGARFCRMRKPKGPSACLVATSQWGLVEKTEHAHSSNGGFRLKCMRRKPKQCGGWEGGFGTDGGIKMERKPSRKIIIDFILIDSDNSAIGYAIHRPGAGKEGGMKKNNNSMKIQSKTKTQNNGDEIKHEIDTHYSLVKE